MKIITTSLVLAATLSMANLASAANFTITSGSNSTARTLIAGETGSVSSGATLTLNGGTVPVTVTGNSTITNSGTISQTGTGRTIDANTANITLTINNSGNITSVGTNETIRMAQTAILNLTNQSGAFITSNAADAIRPGNNSTITNYGTISANPPNVASPAGSDGIDLRTERTGITINNYSIISGRHGIATDGANVGPSSVTVNNYNGGTISALNGSGLNVDGVNTTTTANVTNAFGGTIKGGVFSNATSGDGDGIDIDGVLTLNNSGDVLGLGAKGANNPEGIAAGGGNITNTSTGRIIGSSLSADAPNGDTSKIGSGILIDDSNGGNAVAVTNITNSGLIQGKTGFGIKLIGTFDNTVTNNTSGTIRGAGDATAVGAAIQTGNGNDTVNNAGTITGDNGKAINLQGGNDTLNITKGTINGDIDGGSGTNTLNVNVASGNTFTLNGSVSNFATSTYALGGKFVYSGANTLGGAITLNGGEFKNNGGNFTGTLTLNSGTVSGTNLSGVALTIGANSVLSPGNSPGTMSTASETWGSGGTYLWEINSITGSQGQNPGWDFADITGSLSITATSANQFTIDLDTLNLSNSLAALSGLTDYQTYLFTIATASGGITGFSADKFILDSTNFNDGVNGTGRLSIQQSLDGKSIQLVYTVPEPSTYAMLIGGLVGVVWMARRRTQNA